MLSAIHASPRSIPASATFPLHCGAWWMYSWVMYSVATPAAVIDSRARSFSLSP